MTKILVVSEKHGTRYFDVTTTELLHKVALKILTERFNAGYWYSEPDVVKPLDFTAEDIQSMPESMRKHALLQLATHQNVMKEYKEELGEYQEIQKAVQDKDGKQAWEILDRRSRHEYEYEEVRIEYCEVVADTPIKPSVIELTFDEAIKQYKSGELDIPNFCIYEAGTKYYAYLMGEGAEQLIASKQFPNKQDIIDLYTSLGVQHIKYIG